MHTLLPLTLAALLTACAPTSAPSPAADAGPRLTGAPGAAFVFDAGDTPAASLSWRLGRTPAGAQPELIDAHSPNPVLVPDLPGQYGLILTACDAFGDCVESETWARVLESAQQTSASFAVAAITADTAVGLGQAVALDGTGSMGDDLTYLWRLQAAPAGSALTETDIRRYAQAEAWFLPDVEGSYTVSLYVEDNNGWDMTRVDIVVGSGDAPPTAVAASSTDEAEVGELVGLDGTGSFDPDTAELTWRWAFTRLPADSTLTNGDIDGRWTDTASFTPDVEGEFGLKLVVEDSLNADRDDLGEILVSSYADDNEPLPDTYVDDNDPLED
ncbi:MAG: hypothetical protein H6739_09400 [Alphaproteobacteria bacterium]|nr:hypothetical protein [Alphaproteobacteria bacterium]